MNAALANVAPDPVMERLEDQISWYDTKSRSSRKWFKWIKTTEIVAAAVIPLLAASTIPHARAVTAVLGVLITAFEGVLQLNQFHENWISYRSTCESLKHEKFMFLAGASPYTNADRPRALLAERVESLLAGEHAKWASVQEQEPQSKPA